MVSIFFFVIEREVISVEGMNFGTKKNPKCGICRQAEEDAHYKGNVLQEDVICEDCDTKYIYDAGEDGYVLRLE